MTNPKPDSTPTYTRRSQYRIAGLTLGEVNRALTEIGIRLDQLDGIGQDLDARGRWIRNVEGISVDSIEATIFYLGDPDADGTWRFVVSGSNLHAERRESSAWVQKGRFRAS